MALGDGTAWDESNPQQTTLASALDVYDRDIRKGTRARMANEHIWPASQTGTSEAGQHLFITFQPQTAAPSLPLVGITTQCAAIYFKTDNNGYIIDSAGTSRIFFQSAQGIAISSTATLGAIPIVTGSGALAVLSPGSANQFLISNSSTAAPSWVNLLGSPTTGLSLNTAYLASRGGIVTVSAIATANHALSINSDTSNPPTTAIASIFNGVGSQMCLTIPVVSGNYFKAQIGVSDAITPSYYAFYPI